MCIRDRYPTVKFEQTDIKDEVQLQRVATRLMELGIITPEQGVNVLEKGSYPRPDEMEGAQKKYIEQRKQGMYNPIVGGVPMIEPQTGAESGPSKEVGRPVGTSEIPQENKINAEELYSRKNIQDIIYSTENLKSNALKQMRKKLGKKKLKKSEESMVFELIESVVLSESEENWEESLSRCIDNPDEIINLGINSEIQFISNEHDLDLYSSALLYHSNRRD